LPTYPFEGQKCWIEWSAAPAAEQIELHDSEASKASTFGNGLSISMHARPRLGTAYIAPSTPTQIRLVSLLEPIFGIRPLGVKDNFFALGADSLMAVAVVARLKEQFGVQLAAVHLYETLDITSLASLIEEMAAESLQIAALPGQIPLTRNSSGAA